MDLKDAGPCKGSLNYPDVTPDAEGEYETTFEVDPSTPPSARQVLTSYIKSSSSGLQPAIATAFAAFVSEFNAME